MNVLTALCVSLLGRAVLCGNLRNDDSSSQPASLEPTSVETSLDLSRPDATVVEVNDSVNSLGIDEVEYSPKNGGAFGKVSDGDVPVWTAGAGEESTLVFTYSKLGHPTILSVYINGKPMYLEKNGNGWTRITEAEFNARYETMKAKEDQEEMLQEEGIPSEPTESTSKSTTEEPKEESVEIHPDDALTTHHVRTPQPASLESREVELDIMDIDGNVFTLTHDHFDEGVPIRHITVKSGYRLTEVSDGQETIWKTTKSEYCRSVWLYDAAEKPMLATVQFVKADGRTAMQYCMKQDDGTWKWVNKDVHDEKLASMKRNVILAKQSVSLDIGSMDANTFTIEESTEDSLGKKTVSPKNDHRLTEVTDGPNIIWKGEEDEYCTSVWAHYDGESPILATVRFIKSDGRYTLQYYSKRGGNWTVITGDDHEALLTSMRRNVILSKPSVKLDVANVDDTLFNIHNSSEDGLVTKTFTPNKNYRITEVSDGEEAIWKAYGYKEHCLSTLLYHDGESPALATVQFVKGDGKTDFRYYAKYYDKKQAEWKWVNKDVHDEKLASMKRNVILAKPEAKLNLSEVDATLFNIQDYSEDSLGKKTVSPNDGHKVTEIYEMNMPIWVSNDEYCTSVWAYHDDGKPALTIVHFTKEGCENASRCYIKQNGEWTLVEKEDFDEKLTTMMRLAYLSKLTPIKLDTSAMDDSLFEAIDTSEGGVSMRHITPKAGHRITEVSDGEEAIWKAYGCKEHCLFARVHYDDGGPIQAIICFSRSDGQIPWNYYSKQDGTWKLVDKKINCETPLGTRKRAAVLSKPEASLDVSSPDPSKVDVYYGVDCGVAFKEFSIKNVYRLTEVSDGPNIIWRISDPREHAKSVVVHYDESPILAIIRYARSDGINTSRCCMQQGGSWMDIRKADYEASLNSLKENNLARQASTHPTKDTS